MRELPLSADTVAVFARLRASEYPLCVYGWSAIRARLMVKDVVRERVDRFGVAVQERGMYLRYADEMLKAFRTQVQEPLVHALKQAIRKWANFGLNPELLQLVLCDCHLKFHNAGYQMKLKGDAARRRRPGPRPHAQPSPTYGQALVRKKVRLASKTTRQEQAAKHHAGTRHAQDIAFRLRGLLAARGVRTSRFRKYFAFAQSLGRYCRRYSGPSLQMQAANLIDQWEAESLDRDTLVAIAVSLFDIAFSS